MVCSVGDHFWRRVERLDLESGEPERKRVPTGAAAGVVAWRTKNVVLTTRARLGVLWILDAII